MAGEQRMYDEQSCLLDFEADGVWSAFRRLDFAVLLPTHVQSSTVSRADELQAGSQRKVELKNGVIVTVKVSGLSDLKCKAAWNWNDEYSEMLSVFPVTTAVGQPQCMVQWVSAGIPPALGAGVAALKQAAFKLWPVTLRGLPSVPYAFPALSEEDRAVYLGEEVVRLAPVPGTVYAATLGCLAEAPNTAETRAQSHIRMGDHARLGEEYAHVYVAAIPAPDPTATFDAAATVTLPTVLQRPLIKTADGPVQGLRSGGRSAILVADGVPMRLKGCGNFVDGTYAARFDLTMQNAQVAPTEKLDFMTCEPDAAAKEIRGCAFPHTAKRELLMASTVQTALQPLNLVCGLQPLAYWEYKIPEEPLPAIPKACVVTKTFGERRLASHALAGLDLLLSQFVVDANVAALREKFGACRCEPYVEDIFDPATAAKLGQVNHAMIPTHVACFKAKDAYPAVDCTGVCLKERKPEAPTHLSEVASRAWNSALRTYSAAAEVLAASAIDIDVAVAAASDTKSSESATWGANGAVIWHLCWRLGREVAAIKRAMAEAGISWGYYLDHMIEPHNNSHPNNLILLPKSSAGFGPLVAPVDLDMAYPRQSFYDNMTGLPDVSMFDDNLKREAKEMECNLAGSTASTGLQDMVGVDTHASEFQVLRTACRDTLVAGYRFAMAGGRVDPYPTSQYMDMACHALLQLCLLASADRHS